MTISQAEELKQAWTDKYVVVQSGVAELRRFQGLTGTVKTVNMSGRALVQFDGPVDIGWYDIDPAYLQQVAQPLPKKTSGHEAKGHAAEAPAAKPAAAAAAKGVNPLDAIRKGGAAKPAAAPAAGGKPSPLDLIRQQGGAKSPPAAESSASASAPAPASEPAAPAAATAPAQPAAPPAGMSPLDLIRKQGAAKR